MIVDVVDKINCAPALVMEEKRPPPVEDWAATSEPEARRATYENFMVNVAIGFIVGFVVDSDGTRV